jgi:DMSO/TMAO reductase YedYZ molybdopterin-dependent catalytic subunit
VKHERGIVEMYREDPERADAVLWGRRRFLGTVGIAAMSAALGATIRFGRHMPLGYVPAALAAGGSPGSLVVDKGDLRVLNDRPFNAETPPHLLDDEFTPNHRHFVRDNGIPPQPTPEYLSGWRLTIDGEVRRKLVLSIEALERYPQVERAVVLECAGNGRATFKPQVRGNQWTIGAVGCAVYRGVRLRDVLNDAGLEPSATYTAYYGADGHLSGDPGKVPISRGTPIGKALDEHTLIAFEMNGAPLPIAHGAPARLICPGWPASASGKWVRRIWIRDREHDGPGMTGMSYRMPERPVFPGSWVDERDMRIIERMPVKSVITSPRNGVQMKPGRIFEVRGHAWSGERGIQAVHVSTDFGATWMGCSLKRPRNRHAWQRWSKQLAFPQSGYYELWARATDSDGQMQPMVVPGWNPEGYLNNAMHRVGVIVG